MDLLNERTWLDTARDADLESEAGVRRAFSELRRSAKNTFVISLSAALRKFAEEQDGELPKSLAELKPCFSGPVDNAMLEQYQLVHSGKAADVPPGEWAVSEKSVVDPDYDRLWKIGANGYRSDNPRQDQLMATLQELMRAYQVANGGRGPNAMSDLIPYIKKPEQQAAYREFGDSIIGRASKR